MTNLATMGRRDTILREVVAERERQDARWGHLDCDPFVYLAVLMEEVGEVSRALHDAYFDDRHLDCAREELVQVCAMALQMVERIDTGRMPWR